MSTRNVCSSYKNMNLHISSYLIRGKDDDALGAMSIAETGEAGSAGTIALMSTAAIEQKQYLLKQSIMANIFATRQKDSLSPLRRLRALPSFARRAISIIATSSVVPSLTVHIFRV